MTTRSRERPDADEALLTLVYISRIDIEGDAATIRREIESLLARSRSWNARHRVTGILMYDDVCFAQILEGRRDPVDRVFDRIERDTRHRDVVVLTREPLPMRAFGRWSMACVEGEAGLLGEFFAWRARDPAGSSAPPLDSLLAEVEHLAGSAGRDSASRLFADPVGVSRPG